VAKQAIALPVLTRAELETAAEACAKCTAANKAKEVAEKARDGALAQIFFKMGFTSLEEVKSLSPTNLAKLIKARAGKSFSYDGDLAEFAVKNTSEGKYPKWREELIALNGPAAAAQIESDMAPQYSYSVIEAGKAAPGASGVFMLAPETVPPVKAKRAAAE
jgi:hypothetical protein